MDTDEGKLFIGGIAWDTSEEGLRDHFGKYGEVTQAVIMRDKTTGRPRGFGFVVFADPSVLDAVLQDTHSLDGRTVEAKRALSREEQNTSRPGNPNAGRSLGGAGNYKTKKIFVGGLPSTLTEDQFRQYFETYGDVTDVVIMFDQNTNRPRGFGFISFDTEDAVDSVVQKSFHELNNKLVEVKRALPKDANPGGGGTGGRGGGYQGYGSSGANASSFESRMDGGRFLQPQTAGGAYPPYSSYGLPSYGYGAANNSVAYGGYGLGGGYGSANVGFVGPARAYGNPSAPNAGYMSGPPGALKGTWSSQSPGYGASGYSGSAGYPGSVDAVSAPMGQSPSGASAYGSQGSAYGGYGGGEGSYTNAGGYGGGKGSYTNAGGYGTAGGRAESAPNSNPGSGVSGGEQQTGGGYMGSGYGSSGY